MLRNVKFPSHDKEYGASVERRVLQESCSQQMSTGQNATCDSFQTRGTGVKHLELAVPRG